MQILKNLAPELNPYLDPLNAKGCGAATAARYTAVPLASGPAN